MIDRRLLLNFDWILVAVIMIIGAIGLVTVYSASSSLNAGAYYFYRQLVWLGLGTIIMFGVALSDYRFFCRFALVLHLIAILLLIITLIYGIGSESSNVQRWLKIGPIRIQASELVKFTVILYIAQYLREPRRFAQLTIKRILWLMLLITVPFFLIVQQPDLGTAIVFLAVAAAMLYFGGLSYKYILVALALIFISAPLAWQFGIADYQKSRIIAILNPKDDLLGAGYHVNQSLIAIGSGGFWGKGYLSGSQAQLDFLPARHTDFIFALFAEEWGFAGSLLLVGLYVCLIWRCLHCLSKRPRANLLSVGIATVIALQVLINMGMVIRLLPVVGMPLPLLSYGGSSIVTMMFGLGLVLSIRCRYFEEY